MDEIERVKEKFQNFNISLAVDWLQACIQWCKEEMLEPNYTFEQLAHEVHEQWLSSDLREVDIPVLPPNLSQKKYMVLDGSFSLQMMQVLDISKPMYWQLQQIRKENFLSRPDKKQMDDSVGTGKRVLQLTLTDGIQFVEAMEYKPIPVLNINIPPGAKLRLSGPVTIRRGRIMLERNNITILGGSVESLRVAFAPENVLARALKVPENPNPQIIDVNLLSTDTEPNNISTRETTRNDNQNQRTNTNKATSVDTRSQNLKNANPIINAQIDDDFPTDEDLEMMLTTEIRNIENKEKPQLKNKYAPDETQKQKDTLDEEMELLMEVEKQIENDRNSNSRHKVNKTPDLFEDDFDPDQIDHVLDMSSNAIPGSERNKRTGVSSEQKRFMQNVPLQEPPQCSNVDNRISKTDLLRDFVNEEDLFGVIDMDNFNKSEDKKEIISIGSLLQKISQVEIGTYKINAKYKSIVEKLALRKEQYQLTIAVKDEGNELVCKVHNDVVSNWAGLTSKEITNLKANILSQDMESKVKVENALKSIVEKMLQVDNVIEIQISGKDCVPIIKQIFY